MTFEEYVRQRTAIAPIVGQIALRTLIGLEDRLLDDPEEASIVYQEAQAFANELYSPLLAETKCVFCGLLFTPKNELQTHCSMTCGAMSFEMKYGEIKPAIWKIAEAIDGGRQ